MSDDSLRAQPDEMAAGCPRCGGRLELENARRMYGEYDVLGTPLRQYRCQGPCGYRVDRFGEMEPVPIR